MKALVVGSGAVGLRTASELIRRGVSVTLQSPLPPTHPSNCSWGAGGLWQPRHVSDPRSHRWAIETLTELLQMKDKDLVEVVPAVVFQRNDRVPKGPDGSFSTSWSSDPRIDFKLLTVHQLYKSVTDLWLPDREEIVDAGYKYAWFFKPPIVNSPLMLEHLLQSVSEHAEVNVDTERFYKSIGEMREDAKLLGCNIVVNCTGMGAAKLCHDETLEGARGAILQFDRASCVRRSVAMGDQTVIKRDAVVKTDDEPWASQTLPAYLIVRGDVLVVGGSVEREVDDDFLRDDEKQRLLLTAERFGIDVDKSHLKRDWVGFRPSRSEVRIGWDEANSDKEVSMFHNYGHGGSGWTINVGTAKECADNILEHYR